MSSQFGLAHKSPDSSTGPMRINKVIFISLKKNNRNGELTPFAQVTTPGIGVLNLS